MKLSLNIEIEVSEDVFDINSSDSVFKFIEETLSPNNLRLVSGDIDIGNIIKIKDIEEI